MKLLVPELVENDRDDHSCFPASIRMAMSMISPQIVYTFSQINRVLHRKLGHNASPYVLLQELALREKYNVELIDSWSIPQYARGGKSYLKSVLGEFGARSYARNVDVLYEQKVARLIITNPRIKIVCRSANLSDVCEALDRKRYVIAAVNLRTLQGRPGVVPHSVLVHGYDPVTRTIFYNDPGKPGLKDISAPYALDLSLNSFNEVLTAA